MLGRLIANCADEDTMVMVLLDHAGLPCDIGVNLPYFFEKAGLTTYKTIGDTVAIDWSKTKAIAGNFPLVNAWVNLKGRDPQGVVEPGEEFERVRT